MATLCRACIGKELHCNQRLKKKGFGAIPGWEQCFWHAELKLLLIVYVDDFKMAGPKENPARGWKLISEEIKLDNQHLLRDTWGATTRLAR